MGALRLMWAATAARTSGRVPSPLSSLLRHYASAAAPQPRANFVAGQPTWQTHPEVRGGGAAVGTAPLAQRPPINPGLTHPLSPRLPFRQMLGPSELLPGMKASEFAQRRDRLAGSMGPNALAILPSSATTYMAGVIPFPFRQDPDFMYLTGINQHAVAALETGSGAPGVPGSCKLTLFLEPPSADRARWVGAGLDKAAAVQAFGAHEVYYTPEVRSRVGEEGFGRHATGTVQHSLRRARGLAVRTARARARTTHSAFTNHQAVNSQKPNAGVRVCETNNRDINNNNTCRVSLDTAAHGRVSTQSDKACGRAAGVERGCRLL